MIAIEISKFGGPEVLVPAERPRPVPAPGEVLIKVAAAGVNRPDVAQRRGGYPPPPGASDIPGLEVAGKIAAKSPSVMRAAKASLNGIDPIDVKRSYRYEQGFTFELNLSGVADEHRDAFVEKRETKSE